MSIYALKPKFQALLRPLVAALHRSGATPNGITWSALLLSLAYGSWMAFEPNRHWPYLLLPAFMLLRMALNAIDGMLAREYEQQSGLGAILNEAGDVLSDTALYLPFALLPGVHAAPVLAVVFLSMMSEFVGVLGHATGAGRRYEGPLGKSDRALAFGALGLVLGAGFPILPLVDAAMLVLVALLAWTIVKRAAAASGTQRSPA